MRKPFVSRLYASTADVTRPTKHAGSMTTFSMGMPPAGEAGPSNEAAGIRKFVGISYAFWSDGSKEPTSHGTSYHTGGEPDESTSIPRQSRNQDFRIPARGGAL